MFFFLSSSLYFNQQAKYHDVLVVCFNETFYCCYIQTATTAIRNTRKLAVLYIYMHIAKCVPRKFPVVSILQIFAIEDVRNFRRFPKIVEHDPKLI